MVVFGEAFDPLKQMLEQRGVDLERCWNGNEALICAAGANCINCRKFDDCGPSLEGTCPKFYLVAQLPKRTLH